MKTAIVQKVMEYSEKTPEKLAIIDNTKTLTYMELKKWILRVGSFLRRNGIRNGEKVLISAEAKVEYIVVYLAVHSVGGVCVPMDILFTETEIEDFRESVNSRFIITLKKIENRKEKIKYWNIEDICKEVDDEEFETFVELENSADVLFTSGTTGLSKGVVVTHLNTIVGAENIIEGVSMPKDTVDLLGVPLHHAFGLGTIRALLYNGSTIVLMNGFKSMKILRQLITKYSCNAISIVPAALNLLNELSKGNLYLLLGDLNYIEIGTAAISFEMKKKLVSEFPKTNIYVAYGSTESPRTVYMNLQNNEKRWNSIGKPVTQAHAKIVVNSEYSGNPSIKKQGRLVFYGEMNSPRYYENELETTKVFIDGCYYTNDIGYIDDDGYIYLLGRANDLINVGGKKVPSFYIENIINDFPNIEHCACIPIDDPILGEVPYVFISLENKVEKINWKQLRNELENELPKYMFPRGFQIVDKFPLNRVGKIDKKLLTMQVDYEKNINFCGSGTANSFKRM